MRGIVVICGLLIGGGGACFGQPVITAVTDSAGFGPRVAPGSLASIFGSNLAAANSTMAASSFPLPTTLAMASVSVGGVNAPLLYASPTQINFQVPSATAAGSTTLTVTAPAGTSSSFTFTVTAAAPSIFQYGTNHAVAQNQGVATVNSDTARAASGSIITVYLTGIGAVSPAVADGTAAPSSLPLATATATSQTATIGGQTATIMFLGLTPGFAGLAQANIEVPTLRTGDYPLVISVGGYGSVSAIVSVSGTGTYTSPLTLVGSAAFTNSTTSTVVLLGNLAYICGADSIAVVNVETPAQPVLLGTFGGSVLTSNGIGYGTFCALNTQAGSPYLVDVVGPLADADLQPLNVTFAVFDLTAPTSPVLLGVASAGFPYLVNLSFVGTFAFASTSYFTFGTSPPRDIVAQTGEFLAYSFNVPGQPQLISVLEPTSLSDMSLKPAAAAIDSTYAYIASSAATGSATNGAGVLDVVNIVTPSGMSLVNQVSTPPASILLSFDIAANTNVLLASGNTTGNRNPGSPDFGFTGNLTLTTMDITNPTSPVVLTSVDTGMQVNGTFYTAAFPNGIFAIVNNASVTDQFGPQCLMIVDARTPTALTLYPIQTQFGFSGLVPTSGGFLLSATSLGLNVYQLQL